MEHKTSVEYAVKNGMFIWTRKENKIEFQISFFFANAFQYFALSWGLT